MNDLDLEKEDSIKINTNPFDEGVLDSYKRFLALPKLPDQLQNLSTKDVDSAIYEEKVYPYGTQPEIPEDSPYGAENTIQPKIYADNVDLTKPNVNLSNLTFASLNTPVQIPQSEPTEVNINPGMAKSLPARSGVNFDAQANQQTPTKQYNPSSLVKNLSSIIAPQAQASEPVKPTPQGFTGDLSDDSLKAAQQRRNDLQMMAGLTKAGMQIGGALGGTKLDTSVPDTVEKQAGQGIEDVQTGRKALVDSLGMRKTMFDLQTAEQDRDPSSIKSKMAREITKGLLKKSGMVGVSIPDDATYESLSQALPVLRTAVSDQLLARKLEQAERRLEQGDNRLVIADKAETRKDKTQNWREAQHDELDAPEKKKILGIDETLDKLDRIYSDYGAAPGGPISGRIDTIKQRIGINSKAKAQMIAGLERLLSAYGNQISGTAIAKEEMGRLRQQIPAIGENPESFAGKFIGFQRELEDSRLRVLYTYKQAGKNIDNFIKRKSIAEIKEEFNKLKSQKQSEGVNPKTQEQSAKIRVKLSNGQIGTLPNKEALDQAKKRDPNLEVL